MHAAGHREAGKSTGASRGGLRGTLRASGRSAMRELARALQLGNAVPVSTRKLPQTYRLGQAAAWGGVGLLGALWMIQAC
jgi:hypothetical protein